jgi:biopolymer transport protein TolR
VIADSYRPVAFNAWAPSRAAAQRYAKRNPRLFRHISMTAFLSIEFCLLVLFMIYAPYHHGAGPNLPAAANASLQPAAVREDAIRVAISRDGKVFFGNHEVLPDEIPERIRGSLNDGSEQKAYLTIDSRTRFVTVRTVLGEIHDGHVIRVAILTATKPR